MEWPAKAGIIALLAWSAACGDRGKGPSLDAAVPADQSVVATPADLGADLAQTGPLGCKGYVACVTSCGSVASCADACTARVTAAGKALFDDGVGCGQAFCLDTSTQPARCVTTGASLGDPPGSNAGTCARCLTNALAAYFGGTCAPTTSPDCNPDGCTFTIAECQASTP